MSPGQDRPLPGQDQPGPLDSVTTEVDAAGYGAENGVVLNIVYPTNQRIKKRSFRPAWLIENRET